MFLIFQENENLVDERDRLEKENLDLKKQLLETDKYLKTMEKENKSMKDSFLECVENLKHLELMYQDAREKCSDFEAECGM